MSQLEITGQNLSDITLISLSLVLEVETIYASYQCPSLATI